MANVSFAGSVTDQVQAGETVTLLVTKPDKTIDTLTAPTLADKTFTLTKQYLVAGDYSVVVHIDKDTEFTAADSTSTAFTVALTARFIKVNVTVT